MILFHNLISGSLKTEMIKYQTLQD